VSTSIRFEQVSKRYRIGRGIPTLRGLLASRDTPQDEKYHWAIRDVSFELEPGGSLGIIGPNGAGKTTILKLLSRVTFPTSGEIEVSGRSSALIELGAGFHPDLTGRENVYLNGTILGLRRSEIKARFDRIIDFAGIGKYLDTPVKRYSSGMYARLGFAIAAHVDPEVLLVDEVLAVGDYAFRMKCHERMKALRACGTTLVFVSHNMQDVRRVCDRGIVLYRGEKAFDGPADEATAEYADILRAHASRSAKPDLPGSRALSERRMTHGAKIERVRLIGKDGNPTKTVTAGDIVYVEIEVKFFEDAPSPVLAWTLHGDNGEVVYDVTTRLLGIPTPDYCTGDRAVVTCKLAVHLLDGVYHLTTDLAYADLGCYYDYVYRALSFVVVGGDGAKGVANLGAEILFRTVSPGREVAITSTQEGSE
jgi:lipopolysaccharide transport system ATP-binding protein